jgi:peptidyl-prolyl cis-trans isomerase A (cyclophilin A)
VKRLKKVLVVMVLTIWSISSCTNNANANNGDEKRVMDQTAREAALSDGLYANIQTNRGDIWVRLFYEQAPLTVTNFVGLAEGTLERASKSGAFYDGLTFHRVIDNFMIQGGDPQGDGRGGPGYQFANEPVEGLNFDRAGLLAMANAGPNTNGSQFFITHTPTPDLNGSYTIFGEVLSQADQDVVNSIKQGDVMERIVIVRKGSASNYKATQAEFAQNEAGVDARKQERALAAAQAMLPRIEAALPGATRSPQGVYYVIERAGSGAKPVQGSTVNMHYEGKLLVEGTVFDSSFTRGEPLSIPAGVGQVIAGWDEMLMDMQVGERRNIVLPPELGYGAAGYPGVIPPNAWLQFAMERVS